MSTADRDVVGLLRQRVRAARDGLGVNTERLWEALNDLDAELSNPAEGKAVARALLGTEELAAQADDQARPVVQRILDGELGQDAALAMTRVILDLTHARGEVQSLERDLRTEATARQVVDTEGGERDA